MQVTRFALTSDPQAGILVLVCLGMATVSRRVCAEKSAWGR